MSDWTEIVLYVNNREYDTRGIRDDDPQFDEAIARWVAEFVAEFAAEPDEAWIAKRHHVHTMDARCTSVCLTDAPIWRNRAATFGFCRRGRQAAV